MSTRFGECTTNMDRGILCPDHGFVYTYGDYLCFICDKKGQWLTVDNQEFYTEEECE